MHTLRLRFTYATLLVFAAGSVAHAQTTDHRVRLGFDFALAALSVVSDESGGVSDDKVRIGAGLATVSPFVDFGYGVSAPLTIGLRVRSGSTWTQFTDRPDDPVQETSVLTALPYLECNFSDEGTMRPFIGPTIGLDVSTQQYRRSADSLDPDIQQTTASFLFGAFFGLRVFANDLLSIDPTLLATYSLGGFRDEVDGELDDDGDIHGFSLMLLVGGSVWLGGKPEPAREPAEPAPVYVPPQPQPAPAYQPPSPQAAPPTPAPPPTAPPAEALPPAPPPAGQTPPATPAPQAPSPTP